MTKSTADPTREPAELLRAWGLRVTATRLAVIHELRRQPHADAETLIGAVRAELGSVSAQTIYSVLNRLVELGAARRIEPAGSAALYELRVGDNHHHVVCRNCRTTIDIDCAVGRRPCLTPSETHGFVLDEAEVTFWGICPTCQANTATNHKTTKPQQRSNERGVRR